MHRHRLTRHRHPAWHGHCAHNPALKRRQRWPWLKRCDRPHWHVWWRHANV